MIFKHTFLKRLELLWSEITCQKRLTFKALFQNISITLLQVWLKFHEHRGGYWGKKLPWTIVKEQFPVPRNKAASKMGNGVISLPWQLRCRCNPDHNEFSSLSNTAVVVIFQVLVNGDVFCAQPWVILTPDKSYRATLIWNCIPLSIKILDKNPFKTKLKKTPFLRS